MDNDERVEQGNGVEEMHLELNLGDDCNFRCQYCFEAGYYKPRTVEPRVVDRFIELAKTVLDHGQPLGISFWGGEPMMHMDVVYRVLDELADYKDVNVLLYTNGWFIEPNHEQLLPRIKRWGKRLVIQVSHDFLPTELSHRVIPGVDNAVVERRVLNGIRWLDSVDAGFAIKTTGTFDDLEHHLYNQFINFMNFRKELVHRDDVSMGYTPDTTDSRAVDEELLGAQLNKLLVYFAKHKLTDPHFVWFSGTARKMCSAGRNSVIIDVDGSVLYCHGCLYGGHRDELQFASVFDQNILYKIEHTVVKQRNLMNDNARCAECDALMCFRCNAINCGGDVNNWDACNHPNICDAYRFISRYIRAYLVMRERWSNPGEVTVMANFG